MEFSSSFCPYQFLSFTFHRLHVPGTSMRNSRGQPHRQVYLFSVPGGCYMKQIFHRSRFPAFPWSPRDPFHLGYGGAKCHTKQHLETQRNSKIHRLPLSHKASFPSQPPGTVVPSLPSPCAPLIWLVSSPQNPQSTRFCLEILFPHLAFRLKYTFVSLGRRESKSSHHLAFFSDIGYRFLSCYPIPSEILNRENSQGPCHYI